MWGTQGGPTYTDDLAHFLGRVAPWSGKKPTDSYINLHCITPEGSPRQQGQYARRGGGRAYASMEEYGDIKMYVDQATLAGDAVFMCMSSRHTYEPASTRGGQTYRRALRKAPQSRAVALKALWLDLDVKKDAYQSQREALTAALPFFDKLALPPSMIVSTGNGIHTYIIFDQLVDPAIWQPLANALIVAAKQAGIKFDVGVSRDDDRILRVPGSVNRKDWNNPLPCRILGSGRDFTLAEVEAALKPWRGLTSGVGTGQPRSGLQRFDPAVLPPRPPITYGPLFDRVSADLAKNRVVTSFALLQGACPVVADSAARGGSGDPEPLWFELAKLCHYVDDGRRNFHALSSGDHRYEPAQTDLKFDQVQKDGWPSCAAIEQACAASSTICRRCANWGVATPGQGKSSPIHFAQRALPGTVAAAMPMQSTIQPLNTSVNGTNGIVHAFTTMPHPASSIVLPPHYMIDPITNLLHVLGPAGQKEGAVFGVPIFDVRLVKDITGQYVHLTGDDGDGKRTTKHFPIGKLVASQRDATDTLSFQGFHFDEYPLVRKFFMDLQSFIRTNRRVYEETRNGWHRDGNNTISGFSYGGYTYSPAGVSESPVGQGEQMKPMGDLVMWRQAANHFIGKGCVEMEALMSTAYAAPLLPFAAVDGVIVYGHSGGSGFGKSASLETLQTVWGPRRSVINDATMNAVMARLTSLNNLPAVFDEFIKRKDTRSARQFTELVYNASGGQEKGRLNRNAKPVETRQSQTMLVTAGNGSLVELASTKDSNAIAVRVLEIRMSDAIRKMHNQQADIARLRAIEDTNYGVAGAVYAEFLGRYHGSLQAMVLDSIKDFQRRSGVGEEGRFWLAAAATMYVGASISAKLNLQMFDTAKLRLFLIDQLQSQTTTLHDAQVDSDDPEVAMLRVAKFINEQRQSTIMCKDMPRRGGSQQVEHPINAEIVNRARYLAVRHATTAGVIEISEEKLKQWCQQEEYSYAAIRRALEKGGNMIRAHKPLSLTRGLSVFSHTRAERLLRFDLSQPNNASLLDGVDDV